MKEKYFQSMFEQESPPKDGGCFKCVDMDEEGYKDPIKRLECLKRMKLALEKNIANNGLKFVSHIEIIEKVKYKNKCKKIYDRGIRKLEKQIKSKPTPVVES